MIEKFTALAANSFMKIQIQKKLRKKKGAVPEGRAPVDDWGGQDILRWLEGVGRRPLTETATASHRIFEEHAPPFSVGIVVSNERELGLLPGMKLEALDLDLVGRRISTSPDASNDRFVNHFSPLEDFDFHPLCKVLFDHNDLLSVVCVWNYQSGIHIAIIDNKIQIICDT